MVPAGGVAPGGDTGWFEGPDVSRGRRGRLRLARRRAGPAGPAGPAAEESHDHGVRLLLGEGTRDAQTVIGDHLGDPGAATTFSPTTIAIGWLTASWVRSLICSRNAGANAILTE